MRRVPHLRGATKRSGPRQEAGPAGSRRGKAPRAGACHGVVNSPLACRPSWREKFSTTMVSAEKMTVKAM